MDYNNLAIELGYSYLKDGYGYWNDASGLKHSYDSMDNDYLSNCIGFVQRGIDELINNKNNIAEDIKEHLSKSIKNPTLDDINLAKQEIIELLMSKKAELMVYMKNRI